MIIIRISGGIGNQLFQYALGRSLALKATAEGRPTELKLDTHFYGLGLEKDRSFKLGHFSIPDMPSLMAGPADFKKAHIPYPAPQKPLFRAYRAIYRAFDNLRALEKRRIVIEPDFCYHPEIMQINASKQSSYLAGVWQSEKYFAAYADIIRNDFKLKEPLGEQAAKIAREISSCRSVSLHVRRGDQVADPRLLEKHGALGEDYYANALAYIRSKTDVDRLFIFSDDIAWCEANLRFDMPTTYVKGAGIKDYEEMHLMSLCAHNIIAKSSYSWWGAWLNQNPNKIVVAPKQRFGDKLQKAAAGKPDDLIPETWVKL